MHPIRPPTPELTRYAIDNMTVDTRVDYIHQNAFRYLYLTAGNISEVWGKYAPKGRDVFNSPINGEDAYKDTHLINMGPSPILKSCFCILTIMFSFSLRYTYHLSCDVQAILYHESE